MGNERFLDAVIDAYSVEDIMNLLGLDDEYIIRNHLKSLVLRNKDMFEDIIDMEE